MIQKFNAIKVSIQRKDIKFIVVTIPSNYIHHKNKIQK